MSLLLAVILAAPELTYWVGGSASSGVVLHNAVDEEKPTEPAETRVDPYVSITSSQIEGDLRLKINDVDVTDSLLRTTEPSVREFRGL